MVAALGGKGDKADKGDKEDKPGQREPHRGAIIVSFLMGRGGGREECLQGHEEGPVVRCTPPWAVRRKSWTSTPQLPPRHYC